MKVDNPELQERINKVYRKALEEALNNQKKFLKLCDKVESGKIKAPAYYVQTGQEEKWRKGFLKEALRKDEVIQNIMNEINDAGESCADVVRQELPDYYQQEREKEIDLLTDSAEKIGLKPNFALTDTEAVKVALDDATPAFSKISYKNLGTNKRVRTRLQNEMAQAILNGESQKKIEQRIKRTVGEANYNAARTAQTECTRVRSQARYNTAKEAENMGLDIERVWHCRFNRSRDSHMKMEGQKVYGTSEAFVSGLGNPLLYPGDPDAPAEDVINCHCYVEERVVSGSPTLNRLRGEYDEDRAGWVEGLQKSEYANAWRESNYTYTKKQRTYEEENTNENQELINKSKTYQQLSKEITDLDSKYSELYDQYSKYRRRGNWSKANSLATELMKMHSEMNSKRSEMDKIISEARKLPDSYEYFPSEARLYMINNGVEYLAPKLYNEIPKEDEIIQKVAGGDMTEGSCASLGFAYLANKNGLEVLDFRDGKSRECIASHKRIADIANIPGIVSYKGTGKTDTKAAVGVLKDHVEKGKEYYLCVAQHAAIVRKNEEGKYQYLELQSSRQNGWKDFGHTVAEAEEKLKWRFGARKSMSTNTCLLIDGDSLKGNREFERILGYINTAEDKQKKGKSGDIK